MRLFGVSRDGQHIAVTAVQESVDFGNNGQGDGFRHLGTDIQSRRTVHMDVACSPFRQQTGAARPWTQAPNVGYAGGLDL